MGARPECGGKPGGEGWLKWLRESARPVAHEPAVSRTEIADWYARQLEPRIESCLSTLGRPGVVVVLCEEYGFHADLRDGLHAVLESSLTCEVLWNLPSDVEALRDVAKETVDAMNAGRTRVFVIAHERQLAGMLPVVDATHSIPRFDPTTLAEACRLFYELPELPSVPRTESWVRQVGPLDLLISSEVRGDPIPAIRATVLKRLRDFDCSDAVPLHSLLGLNEVRTWATALIDDIKDALDPQIRCNWSDVERAVVFAGPRGVGRASLARAIAREAGLRWMRVSAKRWAAALDSERFRSRSERIASASAVEEDFDAARAISPAVLFIDDLGSLDLDVAFELGRQIDRHDDESPLLVIGSCADEDVPPADVLKRAAFEHTLYLPLPSAQVLANRLRERFAEVPHNLNEDQMLQLGRLVLGGTASDLNLYIRRAQKLSRREGRSRVEFDDVASAILETPDIHARPKISGRDLEETAYHEAGHAVMHFLETGGGRQLQFVTIVPRRRSDGTALGFVLRQREEDRVSMSRAEALALIRSALGGLAAEELLRGRDNRSTGASSDLAYATRLAAHLIGRCGLGDRGALVSWSTDLESNPSLAREVDQLLRRQYRQTIDLLRKNWGVVDELAKRLLSEQELSGDEARAVMQQAVQGLQCPPNGELSPPPRR
jgi:AAA+ superfamily predicted ATPase